MHILCEKTENLMPRSYQNLGKLLIAICFALFTPTASTGFVMGGVLSRGDIVKLDWASDTHGHALGGGEFAIYKLLGQNSLNQDIWARLSTSTFCVEYNEHVLLNTKLVVGGVSDRSVLGGVSGKVLNGFGNNLGDPIDDRTRYLYDSYANGTLTSSGFVYHNNIWADSLQEAIWKLEGEVTNFSTTYGQQLYNFANAYTGTGSASVFVLNLFTLGTPVANFDPLNISTWTTVAGGHRQDQLFYDPTNVPGQPSGPTAPEPLSATVWILAGVVAVHQARRKRSKRANAN